MGNFVHLHTHSEFSLSSSLLKCKDLAREAKAMGMPAVALTDWNNLFGALYFKKACKDAGVKPIYGVELAVTVDGAGDLKRHALLLAMNDEGFQNLSHLVSRAHVEFGYRDGVLDPYLPLGEILKHHQNLIFLTGGLKGVLNSFYLQDQDNHALDVLKQLHGAFGDRLYLELQDSSLSAQQRANEWLLKLSKEHKIPAVLTCECHYLKPEDALAQEFWMMVERKQTLEDNPRSGLGVQDYCFQSPETLREKWENYPEVLDRTLEIAERCQVSLKFEKNGKRVFHLPTFEVKKNGKIQSEDSFFREEAARGLDKRIEAMKARGKTLSKAELKIYQERLEFERGVITGMGFAGYYLIVSDFIRWAKSQDIAVGPGRGSGAGSLIAWSLDITELDPIEHGLLFERFLNPERVSLPDFDIDFCQARRHEVIRYVSEKYGKERVCQIITFAKEQSKNAIKDVGRVLGLSFAETNRITKLIPSEQMKPLSIHESLEKVPELVSLADENPKVKQDLELGQKIEGALRQAGVHAAGVIIASQPMTELAPISLDVNGNVICQWDMKMSEEAGLVKFDFLGLVTLDLLDLACRLVRERVASGESPDDGGIGKTLRYDTIPFEDPRAIQLIAKGDTLGTFQFESSGMQNICTKVKPDRFSDLAAITALFRPGPLEAGMVDGYIARKHGKEKVEVMFPEMESILSETYGTIVYQEQVLQIAQKVSGYSLGKADLLRRAMGKKIQKEMEEQRSAFVEGAVKNGKPADKAGALFDLVEKFAGYGFNKSHAAAYAVLSAQTAYLKAVYPVEFYAALLTIEKENTERLARYINDAKAHGIRVEAPHINESGSDFKITGPSTIRFGLSAIKNVGEAVVENLMRVRSESGPFRDLFDFTRRTVECGLNKRTVECLILAGAFDHVESDTTGDPTKWGALRTRYLATVEKALEWAGGEAETHASGQVSLFGGAAGASGAAEIQRPRYESGELRTTKSFLESEKELMGVFVSGHPMERFADQIRSAGAVDLHALAEAGKAGFVCVAAMVSEFREVKVKRGKMIGQSMAILKIEDMSGTIEMVSFPEHYSNFSELFRSGEPLVIRAELEFEEGTPKMLGSKPFAGGVPGVEYLAQVEVRWPKEVEVEVALDTLDDKQSDQVFQELASALQKHPGTIPVKVVLKRNGLFQTSIRLGKEFHVLPDRALIESVQQSVARPDLFRVEFRH